MSSVVQENSAALEQSAAAAERPLKGAEEKALEAADIEVGDGARSVDLPGLGVYRVKAVEGADGTTTVLVGIPAAEVRGALTTLILVEVCVTGAGLIAAGIAGAAMVGVALRPLRRVAATATRVSELPLHSGEVAPAGAGARPPRPIRGPRSGRSGAALNRMLGHVGSALAARQESEMRVRQFVADASHELRTPLASIRGYAELTRRGREETGPDTRHALGRIESEAERMTGLVEDLLLLARLDAGRPLSYESTDLSPLVVDAVSDARAAGHGTTTGGWSCPTSPRPCTPTRPAPPGAGQSAGQRPYAHPARHHRHRARTGRGSSSVGDAGGARTTGRASRRSCCRMSSNGSRAATRRARARRAPPGSAWPSCRPSSPRTAAGWRCGRVPGRTVFAVHLPAALPAGPPVRAGLTAQTTGSSHRV